MNVRILVLTCGMLAIGAQEPPEKLSQALTQLQSSEVHDRAGAIDVLSSLGDKEATDALIRALDDPDGLVRFKSTMALAARPSDASDAIPSLRRLEKSDPDLSVRSQAARTIAAIQASTPDSGGYGRLIAALATVLVGGVVLLVLRRVVQVNSIPDLIKGLKSREIGERRKSVHSLGNIGPKARAALPQLVQMLKDPDATVRQEADRTIQKIGLWSQPGAPCLASLKNPDEWARRRAVVIWGNLSTPSDSDLGALIKALSDPADGVRAEASESLGRFGKRAESAIPHLRLLNQDTAYSVRQAASEAINAIRK